MEAIVYFMKQVPLPFSEGKKDGDGLDARPDRGQGGEAHIKEVQGRQQGARQRERVSRNDDDDSFWQMYTYP